MRCLITKREILEKFINENALNKIKIAFQFY